VKMVIVLYFIITCSVFCENCILYKVRCTKAVNCIIYKQCRLVKHRIDFSRVSGDIFVENQAFVPFLSHVVAKYWNKQDFGAAHLDFYLVNLFSTKISQLRC